MIRAVLSAHLAPRDMGRLALMMNKRSLGALASTDGHSFVMPAMQECHLVVMLSDLLRDLSKQEGAMLLSRWEQHFKKAQSMNLAAFLNYLAKENTPCDMLMLAGSEIILAFQDRRQGLYLNRAEQLFRLQPVLRPQNFPGRNYLGHLDFYAIKPRQDDTILCLDPSFVEAFDPQQLEEVLSEGQQVMGTMQGLIRNLKTYEPNYEISWLAIEVNRVERNAVYMSNRDDTAFLEAMRDKRRYNLADSLPLSRVSRVLYGQKLLPVKDTNRGMMPSHSLPRDMPKVMPKQKRLPKQPLGQMRRQQKQKPDLMAERQRQKEQRERNIRRYQKQQKPQEKMIDRLQDFSFEPVWRKIKSFPKKMFRMFPDQPVLSRLIGTTIILLLIVFFALLFMRMRREPDMVIDETEPSYTEMVEEAEPELKAIPPEVTNLELSRVLKSNNLQIRQKPDAQAPLIATANRGEVITQLAEPENGWVYVRLESTRTEGYVFAEYLLDDTGDE